MVWGFYLVLSAKTLYLVFMQVFSDVKLLVVIIGPKTLVFSNKKEAGILGSDWNRWIDFAQDSSFL